MISDKVKPGDVFLHTIRVVGDKVTGYDEAVNGPMPDEAKKKMMEKASNPDGVGWYLAVHFDTSTSPENGTDWVGIPVKMLRDVAAVGSNGKQYWLSNLPCKTADELAFSETGEVKAINDMLPGQLFTLDEEILMMSATRGFCYSMSGMVVTCLPWSRECPVMKLHAKFILEETTWTTK